VGCPPPPPPTLAKTFKIKKMESVKLSVSILPIWKMESTKASNSFNF
jgi:hypothetical protein